MFYVFSLEEKELLNLLPTQKGEKKLRSLHDLQQSFLYESKDLYYNDLLLQEAEKQNNIKYISIALTNRVAYYHRLCDTDSVFYYATIAEKFAKEHELDNSLFLIKKLIIQRYLGQGHYGLALKEAEDMNKLVLRNDNCKGETTVLSFLSKIYQALGKPEKAISYLKESREALLQKSKDEEPYEILGYYFSLTSLYEDKNDKDSVCLYADSLYFLVQEVKHKHPTYNLKDYEIESLLSLAYYNIEINDLDKAWEYIGKADNIIAESKSHYFEFLADIKKLKYYHAKKDYDKMNYYYNRCFDYSKKNHFERAIRFLLKFNAITLVEQGRHDEAVAGYKVFENYVDSVNNQRFLYEINQLGMEYELDKKEDQIKRQEIELKHRSRFNIIMAALLVLFFFVMLFVVRYLKMVQEKNRRLFIQMKELSETKQKLQQFKECIRERMGTFSSDGADKENLLFEKVENYMNTEKPYINSDYGRKNLISDMNTNEVYLSKAIRKGMNMTIQEYINSWRMEYAKQSLLKDMNLTIESVAMDSGFTSIRHFYRLFKDAFGMSPCEFRNYVKENYKT